jgi:hypothetical protein
MDECTLLLLLLLLILPRRPLPPALPMLLLALPLLRPYRARNTCWDYRLLTL